MTVYLQGYLSPKNWLTKHPTLYPVNNLQNDPVNSAPDRPDRWEPYTGSLTSYACSLNSSSITSTYSTSHSPFSDIGARGVRTVGAKETAITLPACRCLKRKKVGPGPTSEAGRAEQSKAWPTLFNIAGGGEGGRSRMEGEEGGWLHTWHVQSRAFGLWQGFEDHQTPPLCTERVNKSSL